MPHHEPHPSIAAETLVRSDAGVHADWPERLAAPAVIASPHSGRDYPPSFLASTHLTMGELRGSEDAYVDDLYDWAPACGLPFLRAHFPRALVDVNRAPGELDPEAFLGAPTDFEPTRSPKVAAGLGAVPTVVGPGRPIVHGKIAWSEVERRMTRHHAPYHRVLGGMLQAVRRTFGGVILIDAHSMPSAGAPHGAAADIVLGDLHGAAASPAVTEGALTALRSEGFRVRLNAPYAGAYTLEHYGRPRFGRHALQIELNRGLYLDERRLELKAEHRLVREALRRAVLGLLQSVGSIIRGRPGE